MAGGCSGFLAGHSCVQLRVFAQTRSLGKQTVLLDACLRQTGGVMYRKGDASSTPDGEPRMTSPGRAGPEANHRGSLLCTGETDLRDKTPWLM